VSLLRFRAPLQHGSLWWFIHPPLLWFCFFILIGSLSLVGFPETSGFFIQKEAILNYLTLLNGGSCYCLLCPYFTTSPLITACYTAKLFYQSFMYDFSGPFS
jgi:NADH:ubiquinone oxidoreductase subunit 5 (subunit L)/multisubunit Na+/H+ antiporter MnhA subunit